MAGGYFQLVAKGVEDVFITTDPQISFFATVYRRYSNFSMESIEIPVQGKQDFGSEVFAIIEKRGDLLGNIYFDVELPQMIAGFDKSVRDILNKRLTDIGVPPFGPLDPITPSTVQQQIDDQKQILMNQKSFYDYLILQLQTAIVTSSYDVFNVIASSLALFASGTDLGLVYIYQSLIQSSQNKVEFDGTHNLLIRNDLSSYEVMFRTLTCNETKGNSHVIMNTTEIIKAMTSRIYFLLFGENPSEIWFIQNYHFNRPIILPFFWYLRFGAFATGGNLPFGNPLLNANIIDIFTAFLNIISSDTPDILTEVERLFNLDQTDAENLLDTPFYVRLNNLLINKNIKRKFQDNDVYTYLAFHFNNLGPTLGEFLANNGIFTTDVLAIQNGLNSLYFSMFLLQVTGNLWLYEANSYALNDTAFLGLTQQAGNLVFVKRQDRFNIVPGSFTITEVGDILEYSDFFFGPQIVPSFGSSTSTPVWTNPHLAPDPFWFQFITLQVRQLLQNIYPPLIIEIFRFIDTSLVFTLPAFFPYVADLTIASNTSAGLVSTGSPYAVEINNYNLYVDGAALNWRTQQHLVFEDTYISPKSTISPDLTLDTVFASALYSPFYVSLMCARGPVGAAYPNTQIFPYTGLTFSPNYAIFDTNTVGNSFFELNYYKWYSIAPDPDPKMFRIRYMDGALANIYQYLLQTVVQSATTSLSTSGTPTDILNFGTYTTNASIQISDLLLNTLFPRIDNTLPLSQANDRLFPLFTTILNSIPLGAAGFPDFPTVVTNLATAFTNNSTQYSVVTTLVNIDPFYLDQDVYNIPNTADFVPIVQLGTDAPNIPEAINVYIFNKDNINGKEIFDIFIQYYTNLLALNVLSANAVLIVKTLITNLQNIRQRYINCEYNRQSLMLPDINNIVVSEFDNVDFTNTFHQSNMAEPNGGVNVQIPRSTLSALIGATETWDANPQPNFSLPIFSDVGVTQQLSGLVTDCIVFLFKLCPALFYNYVVRHKKNYNTLFQTKIMNYDNLKSQVGISNANRITNHLSHLITTYNAQVDTYNAYVTTNTPSGFIPLLKDHIDSNNIDFSKFGTVPVDIVTNLYDYNFVRQIRYEIDPDPSGTYVGLHEEAYNFFFNMISYNWKRTLYDLTLFIYPDDNLLFTNTATINNHYVNLMFGLNTVNIPLLNSYALNAIRAINIYGSFNPSGVAYIVPNIPGGVEVDFLNTFFTYITTNFYTIDELWNYFFSSAITYITNLGLTNLPFFLNVNQNFWNTISPLQMYNNLEKIEKSNPNGFRFTDLYITFIIQQIFAQTSYLFDVDLTDPCNIQKLIMRLEQKSAMVNNQLCKIISNEADILDFVLATQVQTTNARFAWVEKLGHVLIDSISFEIQGEEYERLFFDWLEVYHELTRNLGQERGYSKMIGNVDELTTFNTAPKPVYRLHIPIPFLFCRFSNYHIPLICSQYQTIVIRIRTKKLLQLCHVDSGSSFKKTSLSGKQLLTVIPKPKYSLQAEYIYLDAKERKQFATSHQEYLVELLQNTAEIIIDKNNIPDDELNIKLHWTNNIKYFVWTTTTKQNESRNNWLKFGYNKSDYEFVVPAVTQTMTPLQQKTNFNYTDRSYTDTTLDPVFLEKEDTQKAILDTMIMKFNGLNRINTFTDKYFELVQPQSYTNGLIPAGCGMYSFALSALMMQPSGSCNFSKLDDITLSFTINPEFRQIIFDCNESFTLRLYAVSINVLRYLSGMCGRAFFTSE